MRVKILALLLVFIYQTSAKGINRKVEFDFYGHALKIDFDEQLNNIPYESDGEQFIKSFDEKSARADYVSVIQQIDKASMQLGLDDVGKILLINAFTERAFAHRTRNYRTLIKWYILQKDSMDVMLCYDAKNVTLYGRLNIQPYSVSYITSGGNTYTDLSFAMASVASGRVYEYKAKNAPAIARKPFLLNSYKYPKLNALTKTKNFDFEHGGKKYSFTSTINKSLILYLKDLPMVELGGNYLNYGFSADLNNTLITQFKKTIKDMNQREALGFLLKFVQSIPYMADHDYLGYERYAYCEEVLYNDYADCEDKVILYAALAKQLLGVESVALYYKDDEHVAIALKVPNEVAKYSLKYKNNYYVAAEPTGKDFELGQVGFDLKRVSEVIELF